MENVVLMSASTRDVYVVRTLEGERTFDSFGKNTDEYCDCFINQEALPLEKIAAAEVLVTGTLGLAYPETGAAMKRAVDAARAAGTAVLVDVNWRPVFWPPHEDALKTILPYLQKADIIKMTDEEVEWALGIPASKAMTSADKVCPIEQQCCRFSRNIA